MIWYETQTKAENYSTSKREGSTINIKGDLNSLIWKITTLQFELSYKTANK